jgi:hypothetical protein
MIDGDNSGLGRIKRARLSRGMDGDVPAATRGLFDRCLQFGFRVLVGCLERTIPDLVRTGLIDLDEIGSFFDLLADGDD